MEKLFPFQGEFAGLAQYTALTRRAPQNLCFATGNRFAKNSRHLCHSGAAIHRHGR